MNEISAAVASPGAGLDGVPCYPDIETMLATSHDPIGDFVNAATSDGVFQENGVLRNVIAQFNGEIDLIKTGGTIRGKAVFTPATNGAVEAVYTFTPEHSAQLRAQLAPPTPVRYWLLTEEGDEVLDWRDARDYYAGCRQTILHGGDHSFTQFPHFIPQILEFAGL